MTTENDTVTATDSVKKVRKTRVVGPAALAKTARKNLAKLNAKFAQAEAKHVAKVAAFLANLSPEVRELVEPDTSVDAVEANETETTSEVAAE